MISTIVAFNNFFATIGYVSEGEIAVSPAYFVLSIILSAFGPNNILSFSRICNITIIFCHISLFHQLFCPLFLSPILISTFR